MMGTFLDFLVFFYTTHLTKVQVPLSIPSAKLHTLKNAVLETVPFAPLYGGDGWLDLLPAGRATTLRVLPGADDSRPRFHSIRVYVEEPTDGFGLPLPSVRLDQRFSMDPEIHLLADADGVSILIERAQADLFAGFTLQLCPDVA
jgi:hypothetical protein